MHSIVAILALTKTLNFHSTFSINENIHPCVPLSRVLTFESLFLYISYFHFPNVKLQWKKSILIFLLLTCLLVEHSVTSKIIKTAQGFNEQECIVSTQLAVFTASWTHHQPTTYYKTNVGVTESWWKDSWPSMKRNACLLLKNSDVIY